MTLWSSEFEQQLIKAIIGLVILIVGAQLISTGGALAVAQFADFTASIILFVAGGALLYIAIKILLSILRAMGINLWEPKK